MSNYPLSTCLVLRWCCDLTEITKCIILTKLRSFIVILRTKCIRSSLESLKVKTKEKSMRPQAECDLYNFALITQILLPLHVKF